jgi:hypothetical protein
MADPERAEMSADEVAIAKELCRRALEPWRQGRFWDYGEQSLVARAFLALTATLAARDKRIEALEAALPEIERRFSKPVFAAVDDAGAIVPMPVAPADWHEHPLAHRARWIGGTEDADVVRAAFALARAALQPTPTEEADDGTR